MKERSSGQSKSPKARPINTIASDPEIAYKVSMPRPWTHLLEVEMRVKWDRMPDRPELKMPVWTPGSYLVREYARHVQAFAVKDAAGRDLAWRKTSKNTWEVEANTARELIITYRVYSNELTVRTNELNDEHAFWNNAALLLYLNGNLGTSSTLEVIPYGNWRVATGLPKIPGHDNLFRAENYDILYDSPFEVSNYQEVGFDVLGKKHRIVIAGRGSFDLKRLAGDTTKLVKAAADIFGELPYQDYTFIVNLRGRGGLEHLNSTAVQVDRFAFSSDSRYKTFLETVGHEYFHAFNVKRIKPDVLGPFDYENENYTPLLWVAEGTTAYYEGLLMVRAGLRSQNDYLKAVSASIDKLQNRPGRFETSLEEASFDAWIKAYRPDENAVNNQISYYDKGAIVSMMLDITIRASSDGAKSLDDVMRYLYVEFFKKNKNYTSEDFQKAAELMAGKSLAEFFTKYVRGRSEIDYSSIVKGVGLEMKAKQVNAGKAYLGADLMEENGRLTVRALPADTPAYEQGLNTGDQIIAIDGFRVNESFLQTYIADRKPNDTVKLSIFRFDQLKEIDLKLGNDTRTEHSLIPLADGSEKQQQQLRSYLGGGQ